MTKERAGDGSSPGIDGPRVVLRPMGPEDLESLRRVTAARSADAHLGGVLDPDRFDSFGPRRAYPEPRPSSLDEAGALVVEVDGQVAGSVSWVWREWGPNAGSRCLMIGILLGAQFRGRGIGSLAPALLADLAFRHTTVHRVEAHTDVENVAAQRALEAAGFTREGITRGAQWRDGAHRDGILYAVLRTDPRAAILTPDPRP